MTAPHTIASEDDAFALLERILDGAPLGPQFVVTVKGADFGGT